jgi:hypothetical protein
MTPVLALTNAARLLASHADGTIQCPAQAETALAVALDCLQQAAALSPDTFGEQALLDKLTRNLHPELQRTPLWTAQATRRNVDGKPDYVWTHAWANGRPVLYVTESDAYAAAARACADTAHGLYTPHATLARI